MAITKSDKEGTAEAAAEPLSSPEGTCAVDIRLFLLTVTIGMCCSFLAGISIHLPFEQFFQTPSATATRSQALPRLQLSPADLKTAGTHSPSGQHLLVDIKGIEAAFLDSEERLSDAMVATVKAGGLTMLSYHCHELDPAGVSCVGVLLESHISFHTWPEEGVITLDLFTCGANPLLPVVPVIERLFGIGENITTKWSHELRGFRSLEERKANYLDEFSDLSIWILSPLEMHYKKQIYSNLTRYQRVDIWDMTENEDTPSYYDGLRLNLPDGDERWYSPDYATPDRLLFLDGTIQSMYSSEVVYHEALVHPGMIAHSNPKHVAVLGGGEGATVREVLKHKSVESVTMVEIDPELITIAREYLPKMSDCSDLVGRADNCFDDEKLTVINDNAVDYFVRKYGPAAQSNNVLFDVLVLDALDPEDDVLFAQDLYADHTFVNAMLKSMNSDGVIIIQIGTAPDLNDPKAENGVYAVREELFKLFESHSDVAAMHVYEEPKSGFLEPHSFLIICKDISCRKNWYSRTDTLDYDIYDRIVTTKSNQTTLKHYDGVTQHAYQVPPKSWETVYCRREPTPVECNYRSMDMSKESYDFYFNDEERSSFRIEGEGQTAKVFAKVDIPAGSFIMPEHLAKSMTLSEVNIVEINKTASTGSEGFVQFEKFVQARAHKSAMAGTETRFLEVGASALIRSVDSEEANVGRWVPVAERPVYSPVYDRHRMSFDVFMVATKDIAAGAEVLRSTATLN